MAQKANTEVQWEQIGMDVKLQDNPKHWFNLHDIVFCSYTSYFWWHVDQTVSCETFVERQHNGPRFLGYICDTNRP